MKRVSNHRRSEVWDSFPFTTVEKKNSKDLKVRARPVYQPTVVGNGWA